MRYLLSFAFVLSMIGVASAQEPPPLSPPDTAPPAVNATPAAPPSMGAPMPHVDQLPPPPVRAHRNASLTISPVHLILPMAELTAEFRPAANVGVAIIGGIGRVTGTTGLQTITATATEIGAQFNYYFLRDFTGLHAGVEAIYLHIGDIEQDSTVTAAGLAAGPYLGYKWTSGVGFTLMAQLGVEFVIARAKSSSTMMMAEQKNTIPLLNLNAGWSF